MDIDKELHELKKENQLLKKLIAELPFSFTYQNAEEGYSVSKEAGKRLASITKHEESFQRDEFLITSKFGEFEEIEVFLTPILDGLPHHIVFIDHEGFITLCNLQAAKDMQVNRDEAIGKHIRDLLHLPDDEIAVMNTVRTGKELVDKEVLNVNYGLLNTRVLRNPDGTIKRIIGTYQLLESVMETEKQALAGRIAAGIAHEIRNPLTTVRGFLQHLEGRLDEETSQLFSTLLIPEIDRANKIISDFLSIAKPSETSTDPIKIGSFFNEYLGNFLKSEALLHNANLEFFISPNTENLSILGDREELLQVFLNLFQNSMHAKGNESLRVTLCTVLHESNIQIMFTDNGKGIHPSILAQVFVPFFSTKDEGTGLGLSVSKRIIENHRGTMRASSNENGTTFTIELPVLK